MLYLFLYLYLAASVEVETTAAGLAAAAAVRATPRSRAPVATAAGKQRRRPTQLSSATFHQHAGSRRRDLARRQQGNHESRSAQWTYPSSKGGRVQGQPECETTVANVRYARGSEDERC
eukprot:scaffold20616_cov63-Phaeocystis_antarctica.AAC.6